MIAIPEYYLAYPALFLVIYALLPTTLARLCHLGVVWRSSRKGTVALTFDDGPDPRYTPRVLDILKENNIKACFFVLGEKAAGNPDLLTRMVNEGHEIGNHGFRHRFPWLQGPVGASREFQKTSRTIERITGRPTTMLRPPWGLFNIFSYPFCCLKNNKVVLWSFMSWDWGKNCTPESITKKVLSRVTDGCILVFHDSDTAPGAAGGAPEKMLAALPGIIEGLRQKGLKITAVNEMSPPPPAYKRAIIKLWGCWDGILLRLLGVEQVTLEGAPTLFRVALRKYVGPEIKLPCGTHLQRGNRICEIHINNEMLVEMLEGETSPDKIALRIVRELRRSLPALARHISTSRRFSEIQVLAGITLLHRPTIKMGFMASDIPSPLLRRIISFYQGILLSVYHPAGRKRLAGREKRLDPKIVAISKTNLVNKYYHPTSAG